jgi:hypothetical protein
VKILIEHDHDCPLGVNGLRAYQEAREAFAGTPPEARATDQDRAALAQAEQEFELKQVCRCMSLEQKQQALNGFMRELGITPGETGNFPEGKLDATDEGELQMLVSSSDDIIKIDFGKKVAWIGMPKAQAMQFAIIILQHCGATFEYKQVPPAQA